MISLLLQIAQMSSVRVAAADNPFIIGDQPTFDATITVPMKSKKKDKVVADSFFLLNSPKSNPGGKKLPGLINMHGVDTYAE